MPTLEEILGRPRSFEAVKEDGAALIRRLVQGQGGLRGRALKGGLNSMEAAHPGFLGAAVGRILPVFAPTLQAHYDKGAATGGVRAYFVHSGATIAEDLLEITDGLAASTKRKVVAAGQVSPRDRRLPAVGTGSTWMKVFFTRTSTGESMSWTIIPDLQTRSV